MRRLHVLYKMFYECIVFCKCHTCFLRSRHCTFVIPYSSEIENNCRSFGRNLKHSFLCPASFNGWKFEAGHHVWMSCGRLSFCALRLKTDGSVSVVESVYEQCREAILGCTVTAEGGQGQGWVWRQRSHQDHMESVTCSGRPLNCDCSCWWQWGRDTVDTGFYT